MRQRRHVYSRVAIATGPLQRKLQEPKFRAPTWTDYLCLNRGLTTVDQQLDERILQLHAENFHLKTAQALYAAANT